MIGKHQPAHQLRLPSQQGYRRAHPVADTFLDSMERVPSGPAWLESGFQVVDEQYAAPVYRKAQDFGAAAMAMDRVYPFYRFVVARPTVE